MSYFDEVCEYNTYATGTYTENFQSEEHTQDTCDYYGTSSYDMIEGFKTIDESCDRYPNNSVDKLSCKAGWNKADENNPRLSAEQVRDERCNINTSNSVNDTINKGCCLRAWGDNNAICTSPATNNSYYNMNKAYRTGFDGQRA